MRRAWWAVIVGTAMTAWAVVTIPATGLAAGGPAGTGTSDPSVVAASLRCYGADQATQDKLNSLQSAGLGFTLPVDTLGNTYVPAEISADVTVDPDTVVPVGGAAAIHVEQSLSFSQGFADGFQAGGIGNATVSNVVVSGSDDGPGTMSPSPATTGFDGTFGADLLSWPVSYPTLPSVTYGVTSTGEPGTVRLYVDGMSLTWSFAIGVTPVVWNLDCQADAGAGPAPVLITSVEFQAGSSFHAITPVRIEDSRPPQPIGFSGPIGPASSKVMTVVDGIDIPSTATAVVMDVTVTEPTAASYLAAYPFGSTPPTTANLLYAPGQTVANHVTVRIGQAGKVAFFNQKGSVQVIADVVGYYDDTIPGDLFTPVTPTRILDSRNNAGAPWDGTPLGADSSRDLTVQGGIVPATATAIVMNVSVTGGTKASYLQAYPTGDDRPVTANLLFAPDQTIPNLITVGIGEGGNVTFYNQRGTVHVVADVVGYYDPTIGDLFHPVTPTRALDSRDDTAAPWTGTPLGANTQRSLPLAGTPGIPGNATAVVTNTTVTGGTNASYLSASPAPGTIPAPTASLLFGPGQTVPNAVTVGLGTGGEVDLYNQKGATHVIVDIAGYFAPTWASPPM